MCRYNLHVKWKLNEMKYGFFPLLVGNVKNNFDLVPVFDHVKRYVVKFELSLIFFSFY